MLSSRADVVNPSRIIGKEPSTSSHELEQRRRALGMSYPALARRSGVAEATLKRMLRGDISRAVLGNVDAACKALGMSVSFQRTKPEQEFREEQALRKARRIVALVQGTSALESQAVDERTVQSMVRRTANELLAGSPRKLWG